MSATATKRKPPTPKALQKHKLTLAEAIDQFECTQLAIDGLTPLLKEAKEIIVANGVKTGRRSWKDRIAMVQSGGSKIFDQRKAKQFLLDAGERIEDYEGRSKLGWSLKLLK